MSYQEKRTIVSIASGAVLLAAYSIYAFGKAGMANLENLAFWAKTMLIFIGIGIVALIIIQIVFHILLSISMAVKQKLKDESCDDKEIEKSIEREMVEDEMDKLIELKSSKIGNVAAGVGFFGGLVALALGASAVVMLNILFFSCGVGGMLEGLMQIRYYRKGV
jgi:hypothetical protein